MKKFHFISKSTLYVHSMYATLIVGATTGLLLLIGRDKLGEAVLALLYLVPVVWSTARWGYAPGTSAALTAALMFNFFFIPPFYTFHVGSLDGWLVLAIFLTVALLVVGRIQASLSQAQNSEREAIFMYELSALLSSALTHEAVAYRLARFLHQHYLASLVTVYIQPKGQVAEITAYEPRDGVMTGKPDRVLALLDTWGLAGEVQIWQGRLELPSTDSRIFKALSSQVGHALERTSPTSRHEPLATTADMVSNAEEK